jgi:hypothetical protein
VVASVRQPLIGAGPTSSPITYKRLLDGATSLSAPAQAANSRIPSVKVVSAREVLTRPTGVQCEVRHNTVHHIRTTPDTPVTCRPRRPAPLLPKRNSTPCCEMAQPSTQRVLSPSHFTSYMSRTTVGVPTETCGIVLLRVGYQCSQHVGGFHGRLPHQIFLRVVGL